MVPLVPSPVSTQLLAKKKKKENGTTSNEREQSKGLFENIAIFLPRGKVEHVEFPRNWPHRRGGMMSGSTSAQRILFEEKSAVIKKKKKRIVKDAGTMIKSLLVLSSLLDGVIKFSSVKL